MAERAEDKETKMKKFAAFVLLFALVLTLCSCGKRVGSTVKFGNYELDGDTSNGSEKIEWIVLARDGNRVLLLSKYIIEWLPFNTRSDYKTWEDSYIRKWLNEDFYLSAFNASERERILSVTNLNIDYSEDADENDEPTVDRVFLLSVDEVKTYITSKDVRKALLTKNVSTKPMYSPGGYAAWWLRSTCGYDFLRGTPQHGIIIRGIATDGEFWDMSGAVDMEFGVRPAIWVEFDS